MATKYQHGKVYKIVSNNTDQIYVGSTTQPTLARRLATHKEAYVKWKAGGDKFISSCILLDQPDYRIVLLESYPCRSKDELNSREQHYIELYKDTCVNKRKAFTGLTKDEYFQQYRQEHKEEMRENNAEYYQKNREKLTEQYKRYREEHKEQIARRQSLYRQEHKEEKRIRDKQYHVKNSEKIKMQKAQYRQMNSDKIKQRYRDNKEELNRKKCQITQCTCGGKYTASHKARHEKSEKHRTYVNIRNDLVHKLNEKFGEEDWTNATLAVMQTILCEG